MLSAADELMHSEHGFYVQSRESGVTVHLVAGQASLARIRRLTVTELVAAGVALGLAEDAELLVSELTGNAVRLYGDGVPLVVEVEAGADGVRLRVHDPEPGELPGRPAGGLVDVMAESGRGLFLVSALAPGWDAILTPVGKQIRCLLPYPPDEHTRQSAVRAISTAA
ncbi:ATP-binding protein [Kitasatospora sp. NPDC001095]